MRDFGLLTCPLPVEPRNGERWLGRLNYCVAPKRLDYPAATFQAPSRFTQISVMRKLPLRFSPFSFAA